MRTKNELIEILKNELIIDIHAGMCSALCVLLVDREIEYDEYIEMIILINANRPGHAIGKNYFFPPGLRYPRIEFLNSLKDPS